MKRSFKWAVIGIFLVISLNDAFADCKRRGSGSNFTITTNVSFGVIRVSTADPIGKVLASKTEKWVYQSNLEKVDCEAGSIYKSQALGAYGVYNSSARIFNTNIPGIGFRVTHNPAPKPSYADESPGKLDLPYSKFLMKKRYSIPSGEFFVELIKIAPKVGSGDLDRAPWAEWRYAGIAAPAQVVHIYGRVVSVAPTCSWESGANRSFLVTEVKRGAFRGVGSTVSGGTFNLALNCSRGPAAKPSLTYDFDMKDNLTTVIQNTAASMVRARGIDFQLVSNYNNTNTVISKGMKMRLGNIPNNQATKFSLPFTIRYYQSENNVSEGTVNGKVTLRVQYE